MENNLLEKVVALCKRRGFIYPGSEIYGGLANSWDFGPLGVELKNNIKALWWKKFVQQREDIVGLDGAIIMNPKVWQASGHLENFTDPLIECKNCHQRFRAGELNSKICPSCGKEGTFTESKTFNLMFKTFIGPTEESANIAYLRPETAQAIFVNFKNILDSTRVKIPFGIAQIGKAFRNEITPGNFIFRVREFEQMEIEYFIPPPKSDEDWQEVFAMWRLEIKKWMEELGIDLKKIHEVDVPSSDRAHYSKKTVDFEYEFPFGKKELYGLAYRTDFDLRSHSEYSHQDLKYRDPQTGEEFIPHVIEPSLGVERSILPILLDAYTEVEGRVILKLKPTLAPIKAAVFPLLPNKPELVEIARGIFLDLKSEMMVAWDDRGNIGKRYASQDEVGTPFCITVDFKTQEDRTVTIRDRDSGEQVRVRVEEIKSYLTKNLKYEPA